MEIVSTTCNQMNTSNDDSVELENPAASLRRELECIPGLSTEFCIYRVPYRLRKSNEKFYTPRIVSIGPLHHGREELKAMEEYKRKCLQDFLQRTEVSLEDFVEVIRKNEARLRNCYAETIGLKSHDFVKMILVDSAFVFEVFLRCFSNALRPSDDRIYQKPMLILEVQFDLLGLENQLPLFILDLLLTKANIPRSSNGDHERLSMFEITHNFFLTYWDIPKMVNFDVSYCFGVEHFVGFQRIRILHSDFQDLKKEAALVTASPGSITELHQAGVKLKLSSSNNIFDIRFNNGVLEIPLLRIGPLTEYCFRNLLAFEQCHWLKTFINDYIVLMNFFLNSSKDVDLLQENGIIENWLRDSEGVSLLFHNLVEMTVRSSGNYFSPLVEDLNRHRKIPRHKWMATLKQEYFNTPWASISVVAAVILLVLTFIQTALSVLQAK